MSAPICGARSGACVCVLAAGHQSLHECGFDGPDDPPTDAECGASRFADCPLPLGHPGICEERA